MKLRFKISCTRHSVGFHIGRYYFYFTMLKLSSPQPATCAVSPTIHVNPCSPTAADQARMKPGATNEANP